MSPDANPPPSHMGRLVERVLLPLGPCCSPRGGGGTSTVPDAWALCPGTAIGFLSGQLPGFRGAWDPVSLWPHPATLARSLRRPAVGLGPPQCSAPSPGPSPPPSVSQHFPQGPPGGSEGSLLSSPLSGARGPHRTHATLRSPERVAGTCRAGKEPRGRPFLLRHRAHHKPSSAGVPRLKVSGAPSPAQPTVGPPPGIQPLSGSPMPSRDLTLTCPIAPESLETRGHPGEAQLAGEPVQRS